MIGHSLGRRQRRIDRQSILADQVRDDRLAVADCLAVIDDIGKLSARGRGGVEDLLMDERHARQLEEGKHLEPIAVIVGDAEQFRIGVEYQHPLCILAVRSKTSRQHASVLRLNQ